MNVFLKRILKISLVFTLICSLLLPFNVLAKEDLSKYISESEARLLAKDIVNSRISNDPECPWRNGVIINSPLYMYDSDENINSYIYNFTLQDGKKVGYALVLADKVDPGVEVFSYDDEYIINEVVNEYNKNSEIKANTNKIYYSRGYGFYTKNNKKFRNMTTKSEVTKKDLKNDMNSKAKNNNISKNKLKTLKEGESNNIQNYATTRAIIRKYDISNLSAISFFTTNLFEGGTAKKNCAPTAATTLMRYWAYNRNKSTLWNGSYQALYTAINAKMNGSNGTTNAQFYNGITSFSRSRNCLPTQSENLSKEYATFSKAENLISTNVPFAVGLSCDPHYDSHCVVCFGTEKTDVGNFMRIADGWSTSHQVWYRHGFYISGYMYFKW